jgi:hypothetical protein
VVGALPVGLDSLIFSRLQNRLNHLVHLGQVAAQETANRIPPASPR